MKPAPVPSPCINVCRMDERSGWCVGCFRSLDEIAAWSRLDDEQREFLSIVRSSAADLLAMVNAAIALWIIDLTARRFVSGDKRTIILLLHTLRYGATHRYIKRKRRSCAAAAIDCNCTAEHRHNT